MYRNNALYEAADLDPAAPYADHADLYAQATALTKLAGGDDDQIGIHTGYYSAFQTILYQQFLQREQNGQPWVDESTNELVWQDYPEILQTFEWFCDLSGTADDNSFLQGQNRFALGRAASQIGHPVTRGSLAQMAPDLEYTIVPFLSAPRVRELYTAGSHWMWVVGNWVRMQKLPGNGCISALIGTPRLYGMTWREICPVSKAWAKRPNSGPMPMPRSVWIHWNLPPLGNGLDGPNGSRN